MKMNPRKAGERCCFASAALQAASETESPGRSFLRAEPGTKPPASSAVTSNSSRILAGEVSGRCFPLPVPSRYVTNGRALSRTGRRCCLVPGCQSIHECLTKPIRRTGWQSSARLPTGACLTSHEARSWARTRCRARVPIRGATTNQDAPLGTCQRVLSLGWRCWKSHEPASSDTQSPLIQSRPAMFVIQQCSSGPFHERHRPLLPLAPTSTVAAPALCPHSVVMMLHGMMLVASPLLPTALAPASLPTHLLGHLIRQLSKLPLKKADLGG